MAGSYTQWYRSGTVSVTYGSTAVTGSNTYWLSAGINPGDIFSTDNVTSTEILEVVDNTHLTLRTPFRGTAANNSGYYIIRNFTAHTPAQLAAECVQVYRSLAQYWDEDITTLKGKSAYDIACEHGFTGTEAQWLESLKAAGEISALKEAVAPVSVHNYASHNAIVVSHGLGNAVTSEQINEIRKGSFNGIYPGCYWELPVDGATRATVVGLNLYNNEGAYFAQNHAVVWLTNPNWIYDIHSSSSIPDGGFMATDMYRNVFPALLEKLEPYFPDPVNILTFREWTSDTAGTAGEFTHNDIYSHRMMLPSLMNVTGHNTDIAPDRHTYHTVSHIIWPLAIYDISLFRQWKTFWLDSSVSLSSWALLNLQSNLALGRPLNRNSTLGSTARAEDKAYCWPYILIG